MTTATGHTSAICARKAIGTTVYDSSGDKLGKIEDIVLDKTSNSIMFAVLGSGGVMGMGEQYRPVPWSELDYDTKLGGYRVSFTKDRLRDAPADSLEELTRDDGRGFRDRAFTHYGTRPYWH